MSNRPQLLLFFGAVFCVSMAVGVHDSVFNNYLKDTFALSADARGLLELPRELPGFLVLVTAGILAALPITRVGMIGALIMVAGLTGLALCGSVFWLMVIVMMINSTGQHLLQPVGSSISIGLSEAGGRGRRMGQTGMVETLGTIMGTGAVLLLFNQFGGGYHKWFLVAAALTVIGSLFYAQMHIAHLQKPRPRLIIRKKYRLYYALEFVFGARKQIFITFGPWVLINVYGRETSSIAGLLMVAAFLGLLFKPLAGKAIDHLGERAVLVFDGLSLIFVCIGYGYANRFTNNLTTAQQLAGACFIADNLLFSLGTARAVYLSRIADSPQELSSTLSLGISINHIVSMLIPIIAGIIWTQVGYERVFLGAAILAFFNAFLALFIPAHKNLHPA